MYIAYKEEQKQWIEGMGYTVVQFKRQVYRARQVSETLASAWDEVLCIIDGVTEAIAELASGLSQIPSRPRRRRHRDVYRLSQAINTSPRRVRKMLNLPRNRC